MASRGLCTPCAARTTAIAHIAPHVFQEIFVTLRLYSSLPAVLGILAVSLWTTHASAQAAAASTATPASPTASEQTALPAYRSALEGYQRYTEEKTVNWKDANDATARIGGWRAYAKEASQPQAEESAAKPGASPAPAKP